MRDDELSIFLTCARVVRVTPRQGSIISWQMLEIAATDRIAAESMPWFQGAGGP